MKEVEALLALCSALEGQSLEPLVMQSHTRELRDGLLDLSRYLNEQDRQIQRLKSQRSSLESQVMLLAQQPEPSLRWWDNSIHPWEDEDWQDLDTPSAA